MRKALQVFGLCLFIFFAAKNTLVWAEPAYKTLENIPVQHNGRVKPFISFAREVALTVLGKPKFEGLQPSDLVWRWMASPEQWNTKPFIPVSYKPLAQEFSLKLIKGKISPEVVLSDNAFLAKVEEAARRRQAKEKLSTLEEKRLALYDHAALFREIATGAMPGWLAHPEDSRAGWLPFQALSGEESAQALIQFFPAEVVSGFTKTLSNLLEAYRHDPASAESSESAVAFSQTIKKVFESRNIMLDENILNKEIQYDRLHPFGWASKLYFLALLLGVLCCMLPQNPWKWLVWTPFFVAAFFLHSYGFYLRSVIAGRPPVTNMYESVIWVSWGVAFFAGILFAIYRGWATPLTASALAGLCLILGDSFPALLDPSITPLVPVLRSNFWLSIHVLTITLSYGAFLLAWGLGHAVVVQMGLRGLSAISISHLSQYMYRSLQIGIILLAAGTVLGGVWANYSWGRFWGWDPKETWALIALLGYMVVLHGKSAGWYGAFGVAYGSVVAFLGILMAWYGVNYVLAAGLHSYGFGGGGAGYVSIVALADLVFVTWGALLQRKRNQELDAVKK